MKKFYVLIVVCFSLITQGVGQTYTWNGGASGNWNNSSNWLPVGVPNAASHNVIFSSSAVVNVDLGDDVTGFAINSISVTGTNNEVMLKSVTVSRKLTVSSTSTITPALNISANNTLRLGVEDGTIFIVAFGNDGKGTIDGTLSLEGNNDDFKAVLVIAEEAGLNNKINVNSGGKISVQANGESPINGGLPGYLSLNAGSTLELKRDAPRIPVGDYAISSTIIISGVVNESVNFETGAAQIGNVIYNCPNQQSPALPITLNIPSGATVRGDLKIENTNNNPLILTSNEAATVNLTINGDFDIQGTSSVFLSSAFNNTQPSLITVAGDIIAGGSGFNLQRRTNSSMQPTTLVVKGNIQHTSGSFGPGSTAINESTDLFVVEMAGAGTQTISSSTGSFDNTNNQLTLKINKTTDAGVVNLLSPLAVGRLQLVKGKLTATSTNYVTVRNTSGQSNVFTSTANSFVTGPLRRVSASTGNLVFATGAGTTKRQVTLTPSSTANTTFMVELKAESLTNSFTTPLEGIETNYYWTVDRVSGTANAKVELSLNGAIAGADAGDAIVVAKYDGASWVRASGVSGVFISPGDVSTGVAGTDVQTSFGSYTFGYGAQASVLPIKLESFNAKKVNASAQLNWIISENSNPVSFEVMKSADGINFSKLGTVSASDGKLNYEFTDNLLLSGNNYYRLKMLDKDGKISFSSIVVVMNGTKGVIISSMIPTMVIDRARLNITSSVSGNMQLVVTDISGRVVHIQNASINAGNQEIWLNANRLSSGIFQITGYINGEKTTTIRFFKR